MDRPDKFKYDSNYIPESNFTRIKFGYNVPVLETELNDMQIIQESNRTSIVRRLVPSGFIELVQKEFTGPSVVYNPVSSGIMQLNYIAVAPCRAIVNGYEVNLEGNFTHIDASNNVYNNYILMNLGDAPTLGISEDLVYLEVWFNNYLGEDNIKQWGYQGGNYLDYDIIDSRIRSETSRRIGLCWDIRIARNVNFDSFPNGFGYINDNSYSSIYAKANGINFSGNMNFIYVNASDKMFKDCEFYKDYNLWVAGRPNYEHNNPTIYGKYVFAMPLFKVKRRNNTNYSIENFNGAISYRDLINISDSSIKGDLRNNIRPDKLYYDYIIPDDVIDLRRSISIKEFNSDYYLNKALKNLFTGELQTKDTNQMRRVQFGNSKIDYTNTNIVLACQFNKNITPNVPINFNSYEIVGDSNLVYKDCLSGNGLLFDGTNAIKYSNIPISIASGTIDFFMQPYWNGTEENISQTILSFLNSNGKAVLTLKKVGDQLEFTQFVDANDTTGMKIIVDLKSHLIIAKNIYHIRLSWSNASNINKSFIYINGILHGEQIYNTTNLITSVIQIGNIETIGSSDGVVIEDLVIYKQSFEKIETTDNISLIKNDTWPNLPKDFMYGNLLLFPSFNSLLNNFSDNVATQNNTIIKLGSPTTNNGLKQFTLTVSSDRLISDVNEPIVYNISGVILYKKGRTDGITNKGSWTGLGTSNAVFATDQVVTELIVQYDLILPPGNGGKDLPNEILASSLILNDGSFQEVSFCRKNSADPREVKLIKPRKLNSLLDKAYDYSLNRTNDKCFARLLHYYVPGSGKNTYDIPTNLYGYTVLGIMEVVNRKLARFTKVKATQTLPEKFSVVLTKEVYLGEVIEFVLALGGLTFEYETQTKNLVNNIHTTKILTLTADGIHYEYTLPCFNTSNPNGGVLKSVLTFTDNSTDMQTQTPYQTCYINGEMFYPEAQVDENGIKNGLYNYSLPTMEVDESSFGTPFLKVTFSHLLEVGTTVEIPVLVSYQPLDTDVLSVWYNYIPYQGILTEKAKKVKRISEWKYFITTLSSGNLTLNVEEDEIFTLNNIINRLPGGSTYSYLVNGKDIKLQNLGTFSTKSDINMQLIFTKDIISASDNNKLDDSFFELDTDLEISKNTFQDGNLSIINRDFKIYFADCVDAITKYLGMACLVLDENGEIMLFVIGSLDKTDQTQNKLTPVYGDLFRITNIPTTIQQY